MINIELIIKQRLGLQSTIKALEGMKIQPNFNKIISPEFSKEYKSWDESKKNKFIITIGGKTNFNITRNFLEL